MNKIRIGTFRLEVMPKYRISKRDLTSFMEYFNFSESNPFLNVTNIRDLGDWVDAKMFIDALAHEVDILRSASNMTELDILYSSFDLVGIYPLIDEALRIDIDSEPKYEKIFNEKWDLLFN